MFWRKPRDVEFGTPQIKNEVKTRHDNEDMQKARNGDTSILLNPFLIAGGVALLALVCYSL